MTDKKIDKLYETAYRLKFPWARVLPPKVFRYHDLSAAEISSPVSLQMGNVLPLVAACVGPSTKIQYFTKPSVMNLFWIVIAASGTGKSPARERFISRPLQYLREESGLQVPKFDVSKFTRAGMYTFYVLCMYFNYLFIYKYTI